MPPDWINGAYQHLLELRDRLKAKDIQIDLLTKQAADLDEHVRYYRHEWESACDRENALKGIISDLEKLLGESGIW